MILASECKMMFEKLTEEKPKPLPEIPKIKPLPSSNRDRRSIKSVKSKEEPTVKPQTEEKSLPSKIDTFKNYSYEYTTPSPATSDLPSEKSYSSGYGSVSGTPGYNNGTFSYSYNRYVLFIIVALIKSLKLVFII